MTDHEPAFPHPSGAQGCDGLTKREWLAGQIAPGIITAVFQADQYLKIAGERVTGEREAARAIVVCTDALIAALAKGEG